MSFGYVADVVNFWTPASQNRVGTHAKALLRELANLREETESEDRHIIVVAHSLGELVAENVLILSRAHSVEHIRMVGHHIMAMIFLGTPHCGSDLARWATLDTRIARALKHANTPIVAVLEQGSEILASVQDGFAHALESRKDAGRRIRVTCFAENKPVPGLGLVRRSITPLIELCLIARPDRPRAFRHP